MRDIVKELIASANVPIYTYNSAAEAGNDFFSAKFRRPGIHRLLFDTVVLTGGPRGWTKKDYSSNGHATVIAVQTGATYGWHFTLIPSESYITFVSNSEGPGSKLEWFENPTTYGVKSPDYAAYILNGQSYGRFPAYVTNRRGASPLTPQVCEGNIFYVTPMRFPANMHIDAVKMNILARTAINANDELHIAIFDDQYSAATPNRVVAYGSMLLDTWASPVVETPVISHMHWDTAGNRVGERKSIDVAGHNVYWVGFAFFPVDPAATITVRALPASSAPIIYGGTAVDAGPFADQPCTCLEYPASKDTAKYGLSAFNETNVSTKLPPCIAFKSSVNHVN